MSRIADAFWTLFRPGWDRRVRELEAQLRGLQLELTGALESLNAWAAKEYKRKVRAVRTTLTPEAETAPGPQLPTGTKLGQSMRRRAAILARMRPAQRSEAAHEPEPGTSQAAEG